MGVFHPLGMPSLLEISETWGATGTSGPFAMFRRVSGLRSGRLELAQEGRNVGLVAEPITLGPTTSALMVLAVHETWC